MRQHLNLTTLIEYMHLRMTDIITTNFMKSNDFRFENRSIRYIAI